MTKPKVQTLLLLTTITTMYVAGRPVAVARLPDLPGRRAVGRRRRGDQPLLRPRHRPADDAHRRPPGRLRPRRARAQRSPTACVLCVASFVLLTLTVNLPAAVLALCGFLGYVFVYTVWLKRTTPQNIVIGGAAGAVPPLVGWAAVTGGAVGRRAAAVRDRLLLDAAPLLGAVAADEGRVRAGRRADAAGRARRGRHAAVDPALHAAAGRRDARAGGDRAVRRVLRRRGRRCWAACSSSMAVRLLRAVERRPALRTYLFSLAYLAALFAAMVVDVRVF